ncbi:MAG: dipeptidase PepE [Aliidiomarina sp.]|uniref:dipeptidase PepE n=1 Tax=Aliidiomarina sp. TaxID=1872439 RepID=UPI0025C69080|nr:dipeptidase PepE [Aliidiomarina sp.]MCH8500300.1 dipeptidase PepE [Aliidiomarina sp.]
MRKLLLMSSSKYADTGYLEHSRPWLLEHFREQTSSGSEILFLPYAGVTMTAQAYSEKVSHALAPAGLTIRGIEGYADPRAAIRNAKGILVGGGNTFVLLQKLYELGLLDLIRKQVINGTPYAGWSAGANIAGLSIKTTNDMPIVQPPSFTALRLVNMQLNPHYFDQHPLGFHGETRAQRLAEFMQLHPATSILGLREGTALAVEGSRAQLLGDAPAMYFRDSRARELNSQSDCSFML